MNSSVECALDPLDLEIVERALEGVSEAVRNESLAERESDEGLRAALRRELIQLVRSSGISDPDALRDILVVNMTDRWGQQQGLRANIGRPAETTRDQGYAAQAE